ncbi:hypothetical protein BAOM_2009 [Peribacillus asahii]|uniref:Major facilitator superfamily associated domain-containing protein n=1 Tax=Peribacillus asahii TaxID=228899 RepID=A0A3Q9RML5_9BACI|nr:MFS transporter [Peribacillus asahii]AZV42618.1 hypothetical protein BAOM_2009 [Peribacillus asahii]
MNNQRWLSLNFYTFFFTWGIFLPYWTGWLIAEKNLSVSAASMIMGTGMIVRACSTLFLFPLFTRLYSLSVVMKCLAVGSLGVVLLYIPFDTYSSLFIITVLFSAVYPNLLPAMESSASVLVSTGKIHYGRSRSWGSLGYTIALLIVGAGTAVFQEAAILWLMIIGLIAIVFSQFQASPVVLHVKTKPINQVDEKGSLNKLFASEGFVIVLLISILVQGSHASYYNYGFVYLQDLGVGSFYIGLILNVAIVCEIVFFTKVDQFFSKMKVSTMYSIAALGSTLRWVMIYLFPNVVVFIFSQVLHVLSFGVAHYAFIQYISQKLKPNQIPTAQGMYAAFAMGLSIALLTFLGGFLYEISPKLSFLGMTLSSVPALLLTLFTMRKYNY